MILCKRLKKICRIMHYLVTFVYEENKSDFNVTLLQGSGLIGPLVSTAESAFWVPRSPRSQLFDIQVRTPKDGKMNFCSTIQAANIPTITRISFISAPL